MEGTLTLPGDRRLSWSQTGAADGTPLVLLGGLLSSRLHCHPDEALTAAAGARLVTPDRPGYGGSDRHRGRDVLAVADDVRRLADHLALERFGVVGVGAGAAYALATAFAVGSRVPAVTLVAPWPAPGALDGLLSEELRRLVAPGSPWPLRRLAAARLAYAAASLPERWLDEHVAAMPDVDHDVYARPGVREALLADLRAAVGAGSAGLVDDLRALSRPWGFPVDGINAPVQVWQGRGDAVVSAAVAGELAGRLPHASLVAVPDAGHLLLIDRWQQVLAGTVAAVRTVRPPVRLPRQRKVDYQPVMQEPVRRPR